MGRGSPLSKSNTYAPGGPDTARRFTWSAEAEWLGPPARPVAPGFHFSRGILNKIYFREFASTPRLRPLVTLVWPRDLVEPREIFPTPGSTGEALTFFALEVTQEADVRCRKCVAGGRNLLKRGSSPGETSKPDTEWSQPWQAIGFSLTIERQNSWPNR